MTRLTGWVAAFTCLLGIIALMQLWSFWTSERPFLSIADIGFPLNPKGNMQPWQHLIQVKNSGKETGFIDELRVLSNMIGRPGQLPDKPNYRFDTPLPANRGFVGPQDKQTYLWQSGIPLSEEAAKNILERDSVRVWVYGVIKYHGDLDIAYRLFGIDYFAHRTGFCFLFAPRAGADGTGQFVSCGLADYEYAD